MTLTFIFVGGQEKTGSVDRSFFDGQQVQRTVRLCSFFSQSSLLQHILLMYNQQIDNCMCFVI